MIITKAFTFSVTFLVVNLFDSSLTSLQTLRKSYLRTILKYCHVTHTPVNNFCRYR